MCYAELRGSGGCLRSLLLVYGVPSVAGTAQEPAGRDGRGAGVADGVVDDVGDASEHERCQQGPRCLQKGGVGSFREGWVTQGRMGHLEKDGSVREGV